MNFKIISILIIITIMTSCKMNIKNLPLSGYVELQGHRGARGKRPENSIAAFKYCLDQNVTTLELDLNLSKDKKLILHHDRQTTPGLCTDKDGIPVKEIPIRDLDLSELKQINCGNIKHRHFPEQITAAAHPITLDEFFDFITEYENDNPDKKQKIRFNLELKFEKNEKIEYIREMSEITVKTIEKYRATDRSIIQSFEIRALPIVKKLNNEISTSALFQPNYFKGAMLLAGLDADRKKILRKTIESGASIISPHYIYVNKNFVEKCHAENIKVIPWTVNKKNRMITLFEKGVDGIISDYPGKLYRTYQQWIKSQKKEE